LQFLDALSQRLDREEDWLLSSLVALVQQALHARLDRDPDGQAGSRRSLVFDEDQSEVLPHALHVNSSLMSLPPRVPDSYPAYSPTKPMPKGNNGAHKKSLTVYGLGPFRVFLNDQPVTISPGNKGKLLFQYLLTRRTRPVHREVLMDLFWPDLDPEAARNNLNVTLYGLRQSLRNSHTGFTPILFESHHYYLNPEIEIWLDFETFQKCYRTGWEFERTGKTAWTARQFEIAQNLYQGDLFAEERYEEWTLPLRKEYQDKYLSILDWLSGYYLQQERYAACIRTCQEILSIDDCHEESHCRLMRCYAALGQRNLAISQYHTCVETLAASLGVSPLGKTQALFQEMYARDHGA
jgi:DNA-binding SARP family transcriptional activator